jgi:hypothetical protein
MYQTRKFKLKDILVETVCENLDIFVRLKIF